MGREEGGELKKGRGDFGRSLQNYCKTGSLGGRGLKLENRREPARDVSKTFFKGCVSAVFSSRLVQNEWLRKKNKNVQWQNSRKSKTTSVFLMAE